MFARCQHSDDRRPLLTEPARAHSIRVSAAPLDRAASDDIGVAEGRPASPLRPKSMARSQSPRGAERSAPSGGIHYRLPAVGPHEYALVLGHLSAHPGPTHAPRPHLNRPDCVDRCVVP